LNFRELLSREFSLSSTQLDQLERHYELLKAWNKRLNLTSLGTLEDIVRVHYYESLFLGSLLPKGSLTIADVGSGAGFPGIPIGVYRPECMVTLIESNRRKAVFLRESSRGIDNIEVIASRAESVQQTYEFALSRALRPGDVLGLRLSDKFLLLTTAEDLKGLPAPVSMSKIPWGDHRVTAMFHVKHDKIDRSHLGRERRG